MDLIDSIVDEWISKWKKGCSSYEYVEGNWKVWISGRTDYNLDLESNPLERVFQSKQSRERLIAAFDKFIFYGYPKDCIDELCKRGESITCDRTSTRSPTALYFQCIECEENVAYRTLCGECFENSEHRNHEYRMLSSESAYCCCGETGTWEKAWYCSKHQELSLENENSLPQDVESRASIVIETIVQYIHYLFNSFQISAQCYDDYVRRDDMFCVTMYHSYYDTDDDEYQNNLRTTLNTTCELNFFEYMQCFVREGKITIKMPTKIQCEVLASKWKNKESNIKTKVFHIGDFVLQNMIFEMLIYLRKLLKCGKQLRSIFSKFMLAPVGANQPYEYESIAELVLRFSSMLPREFLTTLKELLVFGMMKEYAIKERFAKMLLSNSMMKSYAIDKHKISLVPGITDRLFTIPDLAQQLIASEGALGSFSMAFCKEQKIEYLEKMKLLLKTAPKMWTKKLRDGFLDGLTCFNRALHFSQGIQPEVRAITGHVEEEEDHWTVTAISTELSYCVSLFLQWCESDNEVFNMACAETERMINDGISLEPDTVEFLTYSAECIEYDSSIHTVSAYLPLFRFFVGLIGIGLRNREMMMPVDSLISVAVRKIFDPVLNLQVRFAQDAAGMWKRNQDSSIIQMFYYCTNRSEILDRDIELLQIVASVREPNEFLIQILKKYDLIDWADEGNLTQLQEYEINRVSIMSSKFLQLLIQILVERNSPEVSDVTEEDRLKHEIIQFLCIAPSPRSRLHNFISLTKQNTKEADLTRLIEEVAIFKKPISIGGNGTYELRQNAFDRFNPLYYHYNLEEMSEANEFQRHRRKAAGEPDCFPPPELPKLKQFFVPMVNIFQCDVMLHIMRTVLEKSSSEKHLEYVLYLIGYALQEEKSNRYPMLSFTEKAAKWNLLECLEKTLQSNRDNLPTDLLKWTIGKYNEVAPVAPTAIPTNVSEENNKIKRSRAAALARRAKVMEEMFKMQKNFMNNISLDDEEEPENDDSQDFDSDTETCILCRETQKLGLKSEVLVMPGYFQYSTVLCVRRENAAFHASSSLLTSNVGPAIYTSSCGHVMHFKCLLPHLRQSLSRGGFHSVKEEFLCPFCESLCNTLLPLLPPSISLDDSLKQFVLKFTAIFQSDTHENALNVWKSLSYTVHVIETILREANKPILGHLSSCHRACLQYFTNVAAVATQLYPNDGFYISYIKNLRSLLMGETIDLNTHLCFDTFCLFVTFSFSEIKHKETIRLVFVAQIVKSLIETDFDGLVDDVKSEAVTPFQNILRMLGKDLNHLSETFIWTCVQKACLPFLRRCVLFFSFFSDDPVPVELTESGGDTFANMCSYLKFPQTREELFDQAYIHPYVQNWFKHPDLANCSRFEAVDPHHINQLIELPQEYFELCRRTASFKCPNNDNEIDRKPLLCLVCGEMICSEMCCFEIMAEGYNEQLVVHTRKCRSGLYLNVTGTEIVLQPLPPQGCYLLGPYLDKYYESDKCGYRRKPLFLSPDQYKLLHTMWLNHGIFEKISRMSRTE